MAQTNFRAEDFSSTGSSDPDAPNGRPAPDPVPIPGEGGGTQNSDNEEVPTGTINQVKGWVGDDKDRAQRALDVENEKENPRSTLVDWLEDKVTA